MRVAATNQLAALLDAHWPGAKAIFANIESPIALQFLASPDTQRPRPRRTSVRSGSPPSASSTGTPAAVLPQICSAGFVPLLRASPIPPRVRHCETACSRWSLSWAASTAGSKRSTPASARGSSSIPTGRSSPHCHAPASSTPPRCSPAGATAEMPTTHPTRSPHWPVSARSRRNQASTAPSASAGLATRGSAKR